jgi:lipoprotein-anchoring transpeptidase ErfK/SrfK
MPKKQNLGKETRELDRAQRPCHKLIVRCAALLCSLGLLGCDPRAESASALPGPAEAAPSARGPTLPPRDRAETPEPLPTKEVGNSRAPEASAPRVYAKTRNVWIRSGPTSKTQWLGMLWFGGSVAVRSGTEVSGQGCGGQWVPVEPRGYVCVDEERATLNPNDPTFVAISRFAPRVEQASPHRYAWVSKDVRRFESLAHAEPFVRAWAAKKGGLFGHDAPTLPRLPDGLSERRDRTVARSALSVAGDGDYLGTGLLLAGDLSWVARADVELLPQVTFQGVTLGKDWKLPLGFPKKDETPVYERKESGEFSVLARHYARFQPLRLEEGSEFVGQSEYFRVQGTSDWVRRGETAIVQSREPFPKELARDVTPAANATKNDPSISGNPTWIEVSILGGYLIAYRGTEPVYATLISAGRGGLPVPRKELISTASTPTGRFFVTGKFKTATMESSSGPIVHSDVPWTQNFSGPHAIHGAYWHSDFGQLKSAGCVNVSPEDGKWLFEFTEPQVPEGWHSVRHHPRYGPATLVVLHD